MPVAYPPPIPYDAYQALAQAAPLVEPCHHCSLTSLGLETQRQNPTMTSFTGAHAEIASGGGGRRAIAPGVDDAMITWQIDNPQHVERAVLRMYYREGGGHFWEKTITWAAGQCPALGSTPFSGAMNDPVGEQAAQGAQAVAVVAQVLTTHLTAMVAPYRLNLTIYPAAGAGAEVQERFIYVDVVVSSVRLFLGAQVSITAEAAAEHRGYNRRNAALWTALNQALNGNGQELTRDVDVVLPVALDGNVFSTDDADMSNNTAVTAWTQAWRDGPRLPLRVATQVRAIGDGDVDAPEAFRDGRFLWDWEGGDGNTGAVHRLARDKLAGYYAHKTGEWPTGGRNTHADYGGKRGGGDPLFVAQADFPLNACGTRAGAAFTAANATSTAARTTEVMFAPSKIAGDQYRVTVWFAYDMRDAWDIASTAAAMRAAPPFATPHARSRPMRIKRRVTMARHWTLDGQFAVSNANFSWARVAAYFDDAGIELDLANVDNAGTPVFQVPGSAAYQAALTDALLTVPAGVGQALELAQCGTGNRTYGLRFRDNDGFMTHLQQEAEDVYTRALAYPEAQAVLDIPSREAVARIFARVWAFFAVTYSQQELRGNVENRAADVVEQLWQTWASGDALRDAALARLETATQNLAEDKVKGFPLLGSARPYDRTQNEKTVRILVWQHKMDADNYVGSISEHGDTLVRNASGILGGGDANRHGIHVFTYDFADNRSNYEASGWAVSSPRTPHAAPTAMP
ncbi:MAG: hypothetical protein FJW14_18805 [Acidimicrobiia bacterium]|nr:hypothetical protein [Acidimicrobiia bacterium]